MGQLGSGSMLRLFLFLFLSFSFPLPRTRKKLLVDGTANFVSPFATYLYRVRQDERAGEMGRVEGGEILSETERAAKKGSMRERECCGLLLSDGQKMDGE